MAETPLSIYGAVLATMLLIWQIVQHLLKSRPRAKLKVTFARIDGRLIMRYDCLLSFKEPESVSSPTQVSLEIANIGEVPICLEEGGFLVTKRKHLVRREEGRLRIPPDSRMPPLPHDLGRGQSYGLFADIVKVREKVAGSPSGFHLTHVYFRDATNRRYVKKLPRRFLKGLYAFRSNNS